LDYSITLPKITETQEQINISMDTIQTIQNQIIIADWMLTSSGWSGQASVSYAQCDQDFASHMEDYLEHGADSAGILSDLSEYAEEANTYAESIEPTWRMGVLWEGGAIFPCNIQFSGNASCVVEVVSLDREKYESIRSECADLQEDYSEQNKKFKKIESLYGSCRYKRMGLLSLQLQSCYKEIESTQEKISKFLEALEKYKGMVDEMEETINKAASQIPEPLV